jgi:hypothetical protein
MKRRNKEMAVIISGFKMGMVFNNCTVFRARGRRLYIPIDAMVPKIMDAKAEMRPIIRVFQRAFDKEWCTPLLKIDV